VHGRPRSAAARLESNFVLEQALEHEQSESCQRLVSLAVAGSIQLIIPAFSLVEPHITLMHKGNERSRLRTELQGQLSELGRSKPYREASGSFDDLTALLIRSAEGERAGLESAIDGTPDSANHFLAASTAEGSPMRCRRSPKRGSVRRGSNMGHVVSQNSLPSRSR